MDLWVVSCGLWENSRHLWKITQETILEVVETVINHTRFTVDFWGSFAFYYFFFNIYIYNLFIIYSFASSKITKHMNGNSLCIVRHSQSLTPQSACTTIETKPSVFRFVCLCVCICSEVQKYIQTAPGMKS